MNRVMLPAAAVVTASLHCAFIVRMINFRPESRRHPVEFIADVKKKEQSVKHANSVLPLRFNVQYWKFPTEQCPDEEIRIARGQADVVRLDSHHV